MGHMAWLALDLLSGNASLGVERLEDDPRRAKAHIQLSLGVCM